MNDLVFAVRLQADGSGMVGQLRLTKDEVEKLKSSTEQASTAARNLGTATKDATGAMVRELTEAKALRQAQDELAKAKMRTQNASRMLGVQINDFGTQVAGGSNITQAFAQQLGQAGFAMADMGGKAGAVGQVLMGPWGVAISLAVVGLGNLITNLMTSNKETEKKKELDLASANAMDVRKASTNDLIDAINRENEALGKLNRTQEESENIRANAAIAAAAEIEQRRIAIVDLLKEAEARERVTISRLGGEGGDPGARVANASAVLLAGSRLRGLETERKAIEASLGKALESVQDALLPVIRRHSREQADPQAAIKAKFERQIRALEKTFDGTIESGHVIARKRAEILKQQERELVDARENARKPRDGLGADGDLTRIFSPIVGRNTGVFGERRGNRNHAGLDIAAPVGTGVRAAAAGTIIEVGHDAGGYGNFVIIDHGRGTTTRYAHLLRTDAKKGQAVAAGEQFALSGGARGAPGAGNSRGPHLHFEVRRNGRPVDPRPGHFPTDSLKAVAAGAREAKKELSDAAKVANDFLSSINRLGEQFTPTKAGDAIAANIAREQAELEKLRDSIGDKLGFDITEAMRRGGISAGQQIRHAAYDIADIVGGGIGEAINAATDLIDGISRRRDPRYLPGETGRESAATGARIATRLSDLSKTLGETFQGKSGAFFKGLSETFSMAADGAAGGDQIATLAKSLGFKKFSRTGSQIGGAIGATTGIPFGQEIGAIIGGTVGSLFKSTKQGAVTLTSATGELSASGNNASAKAAASALGGTIQESLAAIAQQLGGSLGGFNVTVGQHHGDYRVTTGTSLKVKKGAKDFNDDAAAAAAYAVSLALGQGAVLGLSEAVQRALKSDTNIDRALNEALKVQQVEDLLGGIGGNMQKLFRDLERQAAERRRIASEYGFDLVKLEEINAKERVKAFEDVLGSRIGSLKALLDDLAFGDLFAGSLSEQRDKLLVEIAKAEGDAKAGVDGAADNVAVLRRKLLQVSEEAFGTAGGELAADRASTRSAAEDIIKAENDRVKAAQDATLATNQKLDDGNKLANETNDLLAEQNTILRGIAAGGSQGVQSGGGGGGSSEFSTGRAVDLR